MSGLKGVKTMSMGNGSADCLQVKDLRIGNATLGGDLKLANGNTLLGLLKVIQSQLDDLTELKKKVEVLKEKVDSIETE